MGPFRGVPTRHRKYASAAPKRVLDQGFTDAFDL
jgi:hypothetical protein